MQRSGMATTLRRGFLAAPTPTHHLELVDRPPEGETAYEATVRAEVSKPRRSKTAPLPVSSMVNSPREQPRGAAMASST